MSLKTSLSREDDEGILIRGYPLTGLIRGASFPACIHLLLRGELPRAEASRMIEAILVSAVDHGVNAPSIHVARAAASCGVPLSTAVAAGISAIGKSHGGAGEACARVLQDAVARLQDRGAASVRATAASLAAECVLAKRRLPGFGHRRYKTEDPRSMALLALAKDLGFHGGHCQLAAALSEELSKRSGSPLVLNIDGAQAAILSDMGFPWNTMQCFFIIGRSVGLCAHALEEMESGTPLGYLSAAPVEADYVGPAPRPLPPGENA